MNTKNKKIWIFLFTIPCMILFALVYAAPIITVFYTSLCDYTAFNSPAFQGIKNFITIFSDSDFICSIRNTLLWVVLQSTIHVGVGLAMALVLRRKPKGWKFARTAYMIPNIIPTAATGVMFTLLLNPMFGIVKPIMDFLGIDYAMVPNLFGTCVTLASVAMVSQFDIIYMTTKGGPGTSTLNLPIYLYKAATLENNYGKANAVGVVQIIIGITLVILIKGLFREKKEAA